MGLPLVPAALLVGWPYGAGLDEFIPRAAVVWGPAVPALRHDGLLQQALLEAPMLEPEHARARAQKNPHASWAALGRLVPSFYGCAGRPGKNINRLSSRLWSQHLHAVIGLQTNSVATNAS